MEIKMIDFEKINDELEKEPTEQQITLVAAKTVLNANIDLEPFIEMAENFEVNSKLSANNCLSMSLQARKMRQSLDKSRKEILGPHQHFVKEINKQAKILEERLDEIEKKLSEKILVWLENPEESETNKLSVEDGTLNKKEIWDYKILDENLLPRKFLKVDETKIRDYAKSYDGINCPEGLSFFRRNLLELRVKST